MKTLTLLGCASEYMPVIFDIAFESSNICRFRIIKNIPMEDNIVLEINKNQYKCTIVEAGTEFSLQNQKVIFGTTGPKSKFLVFSHFETKHQIEVSNYANLIHPSSYLASSIIINKGVLIEPKSIISSQTKIGFGVTIKRGASIGHHNIIGDFTEINPGVTTSGNVTIGRGCILGVGSTINNNVTIGSNTFIGMGSVVTKDIPNGVIAFGNPCKVLRTNDKWEI